MLKIYYNQSFIGQQKNWYVEKKKYVSWEILLLYFYDQGINVAIHNVGRNSGRKANRLRTRRIFFHLFVKTTSFDP